MRFLIIVVLAASIAACVSISQAPATPPVESPAATPSGTTNQPTPTAAPTPTPPSPTPTIEPTATPSQSPAGTPDPDATPRPTVVDVLPFLTAEVTVVNLAEQRVSLTVALLDSDSDGEFVVGTFDLEPLQVTSQAVVPARLRLQFSLPNAVSIGTCTIDVVDGEELQFAVIESGIAMTNNGPEPADPAEMLVATSTRCQAGEAT